MDFREKKRTVRILNVTSLVDVMFILIIFFMLSTTFIEQPNIKLELPRAMYAEKSNVEPTVLVSIAQNGDIYINADRVQKTELEAKLREGLKRAPDKILVLRADKTVPYGIVIHVMDTAKKVGFKKIVAPTAPEEEAGPPTGGR
jgi:biopolymer transport protein ExbD